MVLVRFRLLTLVQGPLLSLSVIYSKDVSASVIKNSKKSGKNEEPIRACSLTFHWHDCVYVC